MTNKSKQGRPKANKQKYTASNYHQAFRFYDSAWGHLVLAILIWLIGINLILLAIDTGSLLQWGVVFICLFWGLYHLNFAVKLFFKKIWKKKSPN